MTMEVYPSDPGISVLAQINSPLCLFRQIWNPFFPAGRVYKLSPSISTDSEYPYSGIPALNSWRNSLCQISFPVFESNAASRPLSPRPETVHNSFGPFAGHSLIIPVSADLFVRLGPWKEGHSGVFCAAALKQ